MIKFEKILELYHSVGWVNYTKDPKKLELGFKHSTYVLIASEEGKVVGALRSISDESSIHYLQDILVRPDYQKRGIGRKLLKMALDRFKKVRTHMILTDDEEKQKKFYQSLGYINTKELNRNKLNAFVKMEGVHLM